MARSRMIKPDFFSSEQIVECSTPARLFFIGMWCFADDGGNMPAKIRTLKMQIYPGDNYSVDEIKSMIDELISNDLIIEYCVEGVDYYHITGWHHQKIDRPTYRYPSADGSKKSTNTLRDTSDTSTPSKVKVSKVNRSKSTTTTFTENNFSNETHPITEGDRWGNLIKNIRELGIKIYPADQQISDNWQFILKARSDQEIIDFAKDKKNGQNKNISLNYLVPGLLEFKKANTNKSFVEKPKKYNPFPDFGDLNGQNSELSSTIESTAKPVAC